MCAEARGEKEQREIPTEKKKQAIGSCHLTGRRIFRLPTNADAVIGGHHMTTHSRDYR
jgi:hypothetical protein